MPVTEAKFAELMDEVRGLSARFDAQEKKLDTLGVLLTGNGEPEKGLIVKVDRLSQNAANQNWWIRTTIAAAIGSLTLAITSLFKSH